MSLKDKLVEFLMNEPKHLQQIYAAFPNQHQHSIRARIYENLDVAFKRIAEGIYLAIDGDTKALIIQGDSWKVLEQFEDNSVDAIITDPGYTCLNKHYEVGSTRQRNLNKSIGFVTKDVDKDLLTQMFRILKPSGHFFCFAAADAADTLDYNNNFLKMALNTGFTFNKRFIWNKMQMGMGYNGRNTYEQIFFLSKGKRHKPHSLSVKDVLSHMRVHAKKRRHDAEKPITLLQEILRFACKKGDVALDPFGGSMSLAYAGLLEGVHTISVEIDPDAIENSIQVVA